MKLFTLCALFFNLSTSSNMYEGYSKFHETIFVFEMNRHGARSHEFKHLMGTVPADFFGKGLKPGYLTDKGRMEHMNIGLKRRNEYILGKHFLSEEFDP